MALATFQRIDHYGDADAEAATCRGDCALFDFSFLERACVRGPGAKRLIEEFCGRSLAGLGVNRIYYALRAGPSGALAADLTIWRVAAEAYEVMCGRREDVVDVLGYAGAGVDIIDATAESATFALQGPKSLDALDLLCDVRDVERLDYFTFAHTELDGIDCRVGRLGYTGEAGFEIIMPRANASDLWQKLSARARPAGFVAVDMLRIEAGFVLFANEFRLPVSAHEAGLGRFGRSADLPPPRIELVSFSARADELELPWQPRGNLRRPIEPGEIVVTSACRSHAANGILGLGYVRSDTAKGATLHDRSGTFWDIRRTPLPFYDSAKRRPRLPWKVNAQARAPGRTRS